MAVLPAVGGFVRHHVSGPASWRRGRLAEERAAALSPGKRAGGLCGLSAQNDLAGASGRFLSAAIPCPGWNCGAAVAAMVVISWLVWRARRSCPYWLVGWLWFLGTLVPVIGLVQVGGAAMADRYTYFPGIGIFLAVALGVRDGAKRFRISKPIVGAIAGLCIDRPAWCSRTTS